MYKVCAACLHWGNAKFKQRPREEQAEVADQKGLCHMFVKSIQQIGENLKWYMIMARSELIVDCSAVI